jgi:hypothetical protein
MYWIDLAQYKDRCNALVNTAMKLTAPENVRKFLSSCTTGGFSTRTLLDGVS